MKKVKIIGIVALIIGAVFAFKGGEQYSTLEIGAMAPELSYKMLNTNKEQVCLNELKGNKGTLVIFSCNSCPFVIAWEDRYPLLATITETNEIGFALINSNEARRKGDDSVEEMISHAKEMGYANIPYLVDLDSKLANSFGAKTTPHVFLFDAEWKLVYEGAIDDNHKSAKDVKAKYLENAMNSLAKGEKIDPNNTKAMGCSIKRVAL